MEAHILPFVIIVVTLGVTIAGGTWLGRTLGASKMSMTAIGAIVWTIGGLLGLIAVELVIPVAASTWWHSGATEAKIALFSAVTFACVLGLAMFVGSASLEAGYALGRRVASEEETTAAEPSVKK